MATAIKKAYQITIGVSTAFSEEAIQTVPAVIITEHSFTADIVQTTGGYGSVDDETTIHIYNLGDTSFLNNIKFGAIRIDAGTNQDPVLGTVYEGDIKKVSTEKSDSDIITTFICGTGSINKRQATVNRTFFGGQSVKSIFLELVKSMKIPVALFKLGLAETEVLTGGFTVNGFTSTALDKLCSKYELKWYVFNNQLSIQPKKTILETFVVTSSVTTGGANSFIGGIETVSSVNTVVQNPNTIPDPLPFFLITPDLVIGTVENMKDLIDLSSTSDSDKKTGLKLRTFLIPTLRMGYNVRLRGFIGAESNVNGDYAIESLTSELDSWERGNWDSVMELGEL